MTVAFAALYSVAFVPNFHSVTQAIYLSADSASAPYIGELYAHAPHGAQVVLGRYSWYTTLWLESITRGLPAHRELWEVGPWVTSLLGVGLLAWSTAKAAGRWAGVTVAVVLTCASPALLRWQFSWSGHAWTPVHACALGAFLVLLARRGGLVGRNWVIHWLACSGIAAITAAGLASDSLLGPAGVVPFLIAGLAMVPLIGRPAGRRIAISTLAITAVSVVGAVLIERAATAASIVGAPSSVFPINFVPHSRLGPELGQLARAFLYLFDGDFSAAGALPGSVLTYASGVAVAGGVIGGAWFGARWLRDAARGDRLRNSPGCEPALVAHLAFWTSAAVVVSTAAIALDLLDTHNPALGRRTERYVVVAAYAIPAVAAVAAATRRWARVAMALGVCAIVGASAQALWSHALRKEAGGQLAAASRPLLRLARSERLKHGYARYADASPLTWLMDSQVEIYPIERCQRSRMLCPWPYHRISTWYSPRPRTRTFVVGDGLGKQALASLGRPAQVVKLAGLVVRIYGYDVGSRFLRCNLPHSPTPCP